MMTRAHRATITLVVLVLCAVGFGIYYSQNIQSTPTPSPTQPSDNPSTEPASTSHMPSPEPTATTTAEQTPSPTTPTPTPTQTTIDNASNPRIYCSTWESRGSMQYVGDCPVVAYYFPDGEFEPTYVPMPQTAHLRLTVTNNNSQTLQDVVVEVNYRTSAGDWVTVKTTIDSLFVTERRIVNITLANPALTIVNTTPFYLDEPHRTFNKTYYVISISDHEIIAYGYATK